MITKEFKTLSMDDIHPYENNPRRNDEAVADVMASIKQCENIDPIEIDEDHIILSGHTRYKALKELGYNEVECLIVGGLTEEQKKKYRLLANKTGEKATWDWTLLAEELEGMDFEGFDFGFASKTDEYINNFFDDGVEEKKEKAEVFGVKILCSTKAEAEELKAELIVDGYSAELL